MTAAPAKFTFDLDLGRRDENPEAVVSATASDALQQQARAAGYAEGLAAGERSASVLAMQALTGAASAIGDRAARMLAEMDTARQQIERDAVDLATGVARKLAGHLVANEPTAELEVLLSECLASLAGVPHLVIRCHPDIADKVREGATDRINASGFTGRLIVMGEPELPVGDGRIEWADGGLVRDRQAIDAGIDRAIADYFAARSGASTKELTQ